jgi:hypothetical protein
MNNILTMSSIASSAHKQPTPAISSSTVAEKSVEKTSNTTVEKQYLQPDKVEISAASQKKLSESESEEKNSAETTESDKDVKAKSDVDTASKTNKSDIDKEIRELSMEIMELSIKIENLKAKEDAESVKERRALETDLAVKKGLLEAKIDIKLQMATQG